MKLSRRQAMFGMPALAAGGLLAARTLNPRPLTLDLTARTTTAEILPGRTTEGLMSYAEGGPAPVLRLRQGEPAILRFRNAMDELTTVHWHGIRVPHAMDGVAWVSQFPIGRDESFDYAFTAPDAGTYWYHPHCNTFEQLQRGLNGIVIVEERDDPGFDADLPVLLRDFRLDEEGRFTPFTTLRNQARNGTLGNVMTANWQVDPVLAAPSGGIARLRLCNSDVTRLHRLYLPATAGRIVALDGHPVEGDHPWPGRAEAALWLAPGQRADLAVLMPEGEGQVVELLTDHVGGVKRLLRLVAQGAALGRRVEDVPRLAPNPLPQLAPGAAETLDFVFGWSPSGEAAGGSSICGETGKRFWSINRLAAAADGPDPGAPLAVLERGRTYVLRLRNETKNLHPVHLHGLAFRLIRSDQRPVIQQWTDTALLLKDETMEVALVADNPGDWVFHCHVIEHQKTGLSGYLRVT
jgi:FtsP/CotA-like multicopper oxidase with cupredoxin domain